MWRKKVGIKPNRIVSIFFVATVAALLMAAPLMSLVTAGDANASMGNPIVAGEEDLKTIVAEDTPILPQIQGIHPSLKSGLGPTPIEFDVEIVQDAELGDFRLQDNVNEPLGEDGPSPMGSPDPEPMDAPFLVNDVLVYNDAVNSEKNVSLAKTSNGTLYVAYDWENLGVGMRDVYVSKSSDGGLTWAKRDIAVDSGEDESCPTIAGEYSPTFAADILHVWYNNPTLEFAWSLDGDTWNLEDLGGGITWWDLVNCPYVDMKGDMLVVISEWYDTNNNIDTWRVLYAVDGMSWTTYYFNMWPGAWVYQPRVSIQSVDAVAGEMDVVVTMTIHDRSDPNPANWFYEGVLSDATLTGDLATDNWGNFYYMSGVENLDLVSPDVAANDLEVIFTMSLYNPGVLPLTTMYTWCLWSDDFDDVGSASWNGCGGTGFLAFDPADVKDQKYTKLYREGTAVHAVWLNETDINYMFSPNGGADWIGLMKVNDASSSSALDAWHSPDVIVRDGMACVAWHDSRGNDNVYFQTFWNFRWYEIRADPYKPNLEVREVGDSWHSSIYSYLWFDVTLHQIEATGQWNDGSIQHTFHHWSYDGSTDNPVIVEVDVGSINNTAVYSTEFYLMMNPGGGTTNPASGWKSAYTWVTIEAFPPVAPPDGRYLFMGWTGDVNNNTNPCIDCVYMDGPKTVTATWLLQWNVTITTDPVGFLIYVNGIAYSPTPQYFWFNDSEIYNIFAPSPVGGPPIRYVFSHWSNGGNQSQDVSVTGPAIFTAYYIPEYWITIITNPLGLNVRVNMVEYVTPYSFWCPESATLFIEAPSPQDLGVLGERYVWANWSDGGTQFHQIICTIPETIIANFTLQRGVTISTSPVLINVFVDGLEYLTPTQFWWNDSSPHLLEAYEYIQIDANTRYYWINWSDGGARIHTYWANISDDVVIAYYGLQYKVVLDANYPGLTIDLDGLPISLPYVYWCDADSSHLISAPLTQQFGDTRYQFNSWSDGGTPSHFFTCNAPDVITANYDREYRVYINSTLDGNPGTLDIIAGGFTYPTPAFVWWPSDTMMLLDTVEFQPGPNPASGIRYRFVDWDDSFIMSRMVSIDAPGLVYVANFRTQFKLSFVDPHGTPMPTPGGWPVADGFYFDSGTAVQIATDNTVPDTADHRWRFDGWSSSDPNGYTGSNNPADIIMDNPITQTVSWVDQYLLTIVSAYGTPIATGWSEQQSITQYWYDVGHVAFFWIENEVIISADEKMVFDSWTGGSNGTVITAGLTVTANWDTHYLLTIITLYGTPAASGWEDQENATAFWYEEGSTATFWVEAEVFTSAEQDTKAVFEQWSGASNGTTVNSPVVVTATWYLEYLVTIESQYGVGTPDTWVPGGETHQITINDTVYEGGTRRVFVSWSTDDTDNGGYQGTNREPVLTVTGPIVQTANWVTQHYLSIVSTYGEEPDTLGDPKGEGWYNESSVATIEVTGSLTKDGWVYEFLDWTGNVDDQTSNKTTVTVYGPNTYYAKWSKSEETQPMSILTWVAIAIVVIAVVVVIALLLMKRKKSIEAEAPQTSEEESSTEESPEESVTGVKVGSLQ